MRKKMILGLTIISLVSGGLIVSLSFAETPSPWTPPPSSWTTDTMLNPQIQKRKKDERDRTPRQSSPSPLHSAINKLRQAKLELTQSPEDLGGHKARAIRALDEALAELRAALRSDDDQQSGEGKKKGNK